MSQYFPKPYERSGGNIKIELDLMKHRFIGKRNTKRLKQTGNLFRKDLLKGVC